MQIIALSGGKGGVGKTLASMNLATQFAELGQRVLLLDADFGLSNIDVLWGLSPSYNLADVLLAGKPLGDVILNVDNNIDLIPSSSGILEMAELDVYLQQTLFQQIELLSDSYDILIIDTAAGIDSDVANFIQVADYAVMVINDEPTSLTDVYALIKLLNQRFLTERFFILPNEVSNQAQANRVFQRLCNVCDKFCPVSLRLLGFVPEDNFIIKAGQARKTVSCAYPSAPASMAFKQAADQLSHIMQQQTQASHFDEKHDQSQMSFSLLGQAYNKIRRAGVEARTH